jgi:tetratricopeptide (TPR) repeat protein
VLRAGAALIVLAGVIAYSSGLSTPFLFDDETGIVRNQQIRQVWPLDDALSPPPETPVARRPLVNLTLALNYAFSGLQPGGYHVTNLLIHLLAALTLFGIVRRTLAGPKFRLRQADAGQVRAREGSSRKAHLRRDGGGHTDTRVSELRASLARHSLPIAWASALIWTVHPLNSELIEYVVQRTESLMSLFYLLTLYCAIRAFDARRSGGSWRIAAVLSCAAGMACKESMVTAPIVVALYDRVFLFDSFRDAIRKRRPLYIGLAATWVIVAILLSSGGRTSVGFSSGTSPWTYLLNQADIVAHYLQLVVWPRALVLDYGVPQPLMWQDVIVPASLLVVLLAAVIAALVYLPEVGFLGACFFIILAPTSSIVPIATEVGAERRMYLPLAGLVVLAVVALYLLVWRLIGEKRAIVASLVVTIAVASVATAGTIARTREYASRLELSRTIVERRPTGRAHFLLGSELIAAHREQEAIAEFRASAAEYPPAHFALGVELAGQQRIDDAIIELNEFIRLMPGDPVVIPARDLLGQLYLAKGQYGAAEEQFTSILEKQPSHASARRYLSALRAQTRR